MSYVYRFFNNFTHFEISYNSSLDIDQSCGTALHKLYTCRQKAGLISKYLKNPLSKTLHFLTVLKFFGNSSEYQRKMRLFLLEVVFGRMASRQSIDTKTMSFSVPINNTKLTIFSIIIRLVPSFLQPITIADLGYLACTDIIGDMWMCHFVMCYCSLITAYKFLRCIGNRIETGIYRGVSFSFFI